MIARMTPCDRDLLRLVLREDLSTINQQELESHLTTCDICRDELERLAGGEGWLSEVREHLSSTEIPLPGASDESHSNGMRTPDHDDEIDGKLDFLDPSTDPEALGRLGGYEVQSVIGRGGMGIVLKAFDTGLNRHVAIKVLAAELATSGAARRRFARESQAAAAIAHEHVVAIHAVDNSGKLPFLVMPYIPGKSLQERLDESGPLDIRQVLRIGLQAAAGLAAAHAQGLVHRDIKPANILLENGIERVRITDFGLARAVDDASQTQSGFIAGTPQYMAPEQARGEPVDHRADLFSLGSVMYAMCTGRPPFRAETTLAVLRRICEDTPRPLREINPDVPDWLQAIISKLHAREPDERFQTAAEVAELLEQYLAHLQQPATCPLPQFHRSARRWTDRLPGTRQQRAAWSLTVLLLILVTLVGLPWFYDVAALPAPSVTAVHSTAGQSSPVHGGMATSFAGLSVPQEASTPGLPPSGNSEGPSGGPVPSGTARVDQWQMWDSELIRIEQEVRQIERLQERRLSPGGPLNQLQEISEVGRQLRAVELDFNPRSAGGNITPRDQ